MQDPLEYELTKRHNRQLHKAINEKRSELAGVSDLHELRREHETKVTTLSQRVCRRTTKGTQALVSRFGLRPRPHEVERPVSLRVLPVLESDERRVAQYTIEGSACGALGQPLEEVALDNRGSRQYFSGLRGFVRIDLGRNHPVLQGADVRETAKKRPSPQLGSRSWGRHRRPSGQKGPERRRRVVAAPELFQGRIRLRVKTRHPIIQPDAVDDSGGVGRKSLVSSDVGRLDVLGQAFNSKRRAPVGDVGFDLARRRIPEDQRNTSAR